MRKEKTGNDSWMKDEEIIENYHLLQKSHQRNKHLGFVPCKIFGTILKNGQVKNSDEWTRGKKKLMTMQNALHQRDGMSRKESWLVILLVGWQMLICRLFNAKSIFIQIVSSISNNSV